MTEKVPLEAMLRRASRMAENMFERDGEVTAFWLAETAGGRQQTILAPMEFPPGVSAAEAKCALAAKLREHFKEHNVVRYAHASEAWMGPIAEDPRRKEIVCLNADDGCECLMAMREIVRPAGGKPYLAKLSEIERVGQPQGRLMDLLNDDIRPSSELADDEGTVFITNVPGAPFQIIGRRGPTGELFVRQVGADLPRGTIEQMTREFEAKTEIEVEIVTGPEAERLVRGMQRRVAKH